MDAIKRLIVLIGGAGGSPIGTDAIELTDDDGFTILADDDGTTHLTDD